MRERARRLWLIGGLLLGTISPSLTVAGASMVPNASPPAGFGEGSAFCGQAIPGGYDLGSSFDNVYAGGFNQSAQEVQQASLMVS